MADRGDPSRPDRAAVSGLAPNGQDPPRPGEGAGTQPSPGTPPSSGIQGALPVVSLPRGGGAIRGIGEKFAVNPVTGTGGVTVPLATSPGRSGFGPELSLGYDSGNGNGIFGFGWSLAVPAITRKTDKGIPRYLDDDESDVFILSGAEDLVPVLGADGKRLSLPRTVHEVRYRVHPYLPRIEGGFARVERWVEVDTG